MLKRRLACLLAIALTAAVVWGAYALRFPPEERLPGAAGDDRQLMRIWLVSSIGGGESWLRDCLKDWEKSNPHVMTYLRAVSPDELTREDAVLPDIVLYTPGVITAPEKIFAPLDGGDGVGEALLRCGRWQGEQYGLPLCYGAYALAIDSALEPLPAQTPAPTTLLGKPAATMQPSATETPDYPLQAASAAQVPLLAPRGAGLFTLACLLPQQDRPPLPDTLGDTSHVYQQFQARQAATAILTTGQITAFSGTVSAGKGFPFRVMTPSEIITDQVFMASVVSGAADDAPRLLSHLISAASQRKLAQQGLHTCLDALKLYVSGTDALVEQAAARSLTALNAYVPAADVETSAWQVLQGQTGLSDALLPLI